MLITINAQVLDKFLSERQTEVLVIGGGTGGTAAGIQSARLGAKTIIVDHTSWLGGMLTSAGISEADGNDKLPSGLWQEFRESLYKYYGGKAAVSTGWVSNTLWEPHVGNNIFKNMVSKEKELQVIYNSRFLHVLKQGDKVIGAVFTNNQGKQFKVFANVVIDATELGDVFADAGAKYDVGMEAKSYTGEECALDSAINIIQDITYVATLKDFGKGTNKTIPRPSSYDSTLFFCSCKSKECPDAQWSAKKMLDYGKLPNHKYMICWPEHGNDFYLNAIEMNYEQREKAYKAAKEKTLCFVYYIQHSLGYKNLGLANDEYPTKDKLPLIPYNREGRRVRGVVRLTENFLSHPYSQPEKLYRTAISVGDYPTDLHIKEAPNEPKRKFPNVPSFGVPLGCLIPEKIDGLIVCEKGISVSNVVNGATRLGPVVLLTGQAAGVLAALCAENNIEPRAVNVRKVQKKLLNANAYLLPYIDVKPNDPNFKSIQRIGVTGIIKGVGNPYDWENQTWFYPDRPISQYELVQGLKSYYPIFDNYNDATGETLTIPSILKIISMAGSKISPSQIKHDWEKFQFNKTFDENLLLNRRMVAVIIDYYLHPFDLPIDLYGKLK
jgi:hypothetical protein